MDKEKKDWVEFKNPKTGHKVGYITKNGDKDVYVSERTKDHYFKKYCGFGISEDVLNQLEKENIIEIYLECKELDEIFKTTVSEFKGCKSYNNIDEDKQKVMPLQQFEKMMSRKIFRDLVETLKQFISVKKEEYHTLALWIMHTCLVKEFGVTPYIRLVGMPGTGKSTIMRLCSKLVRYGIMGSFSEASIFRMNKEALPSLFFNEFEHIKDNKLMIEILNNGYEDGQMVSRVDKDGQVSFFDPFCPKMFGTVYKESIPTLDSRSIWINTFKSPRKLRSLIGKDTTREERLMKLQLKIYEYITLNKSNILGLHSEIEIPLSNRAEQIIKPLATIERYLNVDELVVQTYKDKIYYSLVKSMQTDTGLKVARILYEQKGKISLKELTKKANDELEYPKHEKYFGGVLRNIGFSDYIKRQGDGTTIEIPVKQIIDLFEGRNIDKEMLDRISGEHCERSERPEESKEEQETGSPPQLGLFKEFAEI